MTSVYVCFILPCFYSGCVCLPMKCLIERQTILFYQRILKGSSPILRVLLRMKQRFVSSLLVKYNIPSLGCPKHVIKSRMWDSFLTRVKIMDMSIIWPRCDSLSGILDFILAIFLLFTCTIV